MCYSLNRAIIRELSIDIQQVYASNCRKQIFYIFSKQLMNQKAFGEEFLALLDH